MTTEACEPVIADLPAYVRGLLESPAAASVERHVRTCPGCRNELKELEQLERVLTDHLPTMIPSPTFASTFANRLAAEVLAEEERFATSGGLFGWRIPSWAIPLGVAATLAVVVLSSGLRTEAPTGPVANVPNENPSRVDGAEAPGRAEVAVARKPKPKGSIAETVAAAPPAELLEKADLFVDYSVIRELDALESAERAG
jgi:anti-sigma factor RsiW